jgi:hypothetical protein
MLVSCLESTIKHHSLSFLGFSESIIFVFGSVHTATKIQVAFIVFQLFSFISSTNIVPVIFSTSSFKTSSIFLVSFILSIHISSALKVSLL